MPVLEFTSDPDPDRRPDHHLAINDDSTITCPNTGDGQEHNVELFEWVERSWSVKVKDGTIIADTMTDETRWESSHPEGYGLICRGCLWSANGIDLEPDFI